MGTTNKFRKGDYFISNIPKNIFGQQFIIIGKITKIIFMKDRFSLFTRFEYSLIYCNDEGLRDVLMDDNNCHFYKFSTYYHHAKKIKKRDIGVEIL